MAYPNLPNNRLIVNGVDLTTEYGMILVDGYTLNPPTAKTYTIDVPGGNGVVDLTEYIAGDVVYNNRTQEFSFYIIGVNDFEALKTEVSNFLHGKAFDYKITMDPDYTYHGRFSVSSYTHGAFSIGIVGVIVISIDADPYKTKGVITNAFNVSEGKIVYLKNGRKAVRPTLEFSDDTIVVFEDKRFATPKGSYKFNDIVLKQGINPIFFMPQNHKQWVTHRDLNAYTWKEIRSNKRIFEWYAGVSKIYISKAVLLATEDISGVVTFTLTDSDGLSYNQSLDLGDLVLSQVDTTYDKLVISDNKAFVTIHEKLEDETIKSYEYAFDFPMLYTQASRITSLTQDSSGELTYETAGIKILPNLINATYGDYSSNGDYAMTHADMKKYRHSMLKQIEDGDIFKIYNIGSEMVYTQHEWFDL